MVETAKFEFINLIKQYLKTSQDKQGYDIHNSDIEWGSIKIYDILMTKGLNSNIIYRDLIYINRKSPIGCFALTFNNLIIDSIMTRDVKGLENVLYKGKTPEFDDNTLLTEKEYNDIQRKIELESIAISSYLDKRLHSNYETDYVKCYKEVCVVINEENEFLIENCGNKTWISDKYVSYCFEIVELLLRIYINDINPYTGEKFSPNIREKIKIDYETPMKFIARYVQ